VQLTYFFGIGHHVLQVIARIKHHLRQTPNCTEKLGEQLIVADQYGTGEVTAEGIQVTSKYGPQHMLVPMYNIS
jgi:hypothetical protein